MHLRNQPEMYYILPLFEHKKTIYDTDQDRFYYLITIEVCCLIVSLATQVNIKIKNKLFNLFIFNDQFYCARLIDAC